MTAKTVFTPGNLSMAMFWIEKFARMYVGLSVDRKTQLDNYYTQFVRLDSAVGTHIKSIYPEIELLIGREMDYLMTPIGAENERLEADWTDMHNRLLSWLELSDPTQAWDELKYQLQTIVLSGRRLRGRWNHDRMLLDANLVTWKSWLEDGKAVDTFESIKDTLETMQATADSLVRPGLPRTLKLP